MTLDLVTDPATLERIEDLAEQLADIAVGQKSSEMTMALCLTLAASITRICPRELWHRALADVTKAIADNIGVDEFEQERPN